MTPKSKLSGHVTVHGGAADSATVEIHNATGDVIDQVRVDDAGFYRYHLSSGQWTLRVWDAHGHAGKAEVTLADNEEKVVDIELDEPAGGH
jgi:Carboxypeptidase regulatory-like domain